MISAAEIDAVTAQIVRDGASEQTTAALRRAWPDRHFTYCLDDDIAAVTPVRSQEDFNLYLVTSGSGACLGLTAGAEDATGFVIAERNGDD